MLQLFFVCFFPNFFRYSLSFVVCCFFLPVSIFFLFSSIYLFIFIYLLFRSFCLLTLCFYLPLLMSVNTMQHVF